MKQVIITRAAEDAERTAAALRFAGFDPLIAPLVSYERKPFQLPPGEFAGVILTSGQAAAALAVETAAPLLSLPVFTAGAQTAERARAAGARDVRAGSGNAAALAAVIADAMPEGSRLLYLAGAPRKPDLEGLLPAAGFRLEVCEAYVTQQAKRLPDNLAAALKSGAASGALHFSRESAGHFVKLADAAGLTAEARGLVHVCISADAASALAGVPPERIRIAAKPDQSSLIAALRSDERAAVSARPPPVLGAGAMSARETVPKPKRGIIRPAAAFAAGGLLLAGLAWKVAGDIDNQEKRLAAAESGAQAAVRQAAELKQAAEGLSTRLQAAEAAQRQAAEAAAPLAQRMAGLERGLDGLEKSLSAIRQQNPARGMADIEAAVKALQAEASALSKRLDTAALAAAADSKGDAAAVLAPLVQRLEAAEARAKAAPQAVAPQPGAARLPLIAAAKAGFESGRPLGALVRALQGQGLDAAALLPFAESGAPSLASLARELSELAPKLNAPAQPAKDAGLLERFSASARSLVTSPGSGAAEASVKAAEAALARGDLAQAAAALSGLPPQAREAAASFLQKLAARLRARDALVRLEAEALRALAAPGN